MKYDEHNDYIADDVKDYFKEQYQAQGIRAVPGHWPAMQTKEDVDEYMKSLKLLDTIFDKMEGKKC